MKFVGYNLGSASQPIDSMEIGMNVIQVFDHLSEILH